MIKFFPKRRLPSSVLGLTLDGSGMDAVHVRRTNGSMAVLKSVAAPLALNLLTDDAELVGREIRNHLDQAGIRERRCVVCVPLNWALTVQIKVPELPEADVQSFLDIEAERGFPYGQDTLSMANSRCRTASGESYATMVAIPRNHLTQLQQALKAAQLRPLSFTLGITTLPASRNETEGVLTLMAGEKDISLQVTCGTGVAALRTLDGAVDAEGAQKHLNTDALNREIRITLGQLPAELRDSVRKVKIFGRGDFAQRFIREMTPSLQQMGLQIDVATTYAPDEFGGALPSGTEISPSLSAAARYLRGAESRFEFLPPKVNPWQQVAGRFSSKKLAWSAGTAGTIVVLAAAAFSIQQWKLSGLETKWKQMEQKVTDIDDMQQQIKKYRPWFDESFRSLSILKKLAEAFPEDGSVASVKTLEIREPSMVSCSGTARDRPTLYKVLDQLRSTKQVSDVKIDSVRGNTPLQFTFNFQWVERGANEN